MKPLWPRFPGPHLGDQIQIAKEELPVYDIIISPGCTFSAKNGIPYPNRHYPHWPKVLRAIRSKNYLINLHERDSEVYGELAGLQFSGTLVELMVLISRAKVLVSVESGAVHLATVLGVPVVELLSQHQPGWPEGEGRVPVSHKSVVYPLIEPRIGDIPPEAIINAINYIMP